MLTQENRDVLSRFFCAWFSLGKTL
jgi:hypothetical protein